MADLRHVLMVTDLDATFFSHPARLSPRNIEAIRAFQAQGGHFTAATGRIPPNIIRAIPHCADLFNAPAITANGAYIYDLSARQCIRGVPMDPIRVKEVAAFVEQLNPRVGMRVSLGQSMRVNSDRMVPAIQRDVGDPTIYNGVLAPLSEWPDEGEDWYKLVFRGEFEELCAIRPAVEERFGAWFEMNASSPRFFELQAKGCNKGAALRYLADRMAAEFGHPILTVAVGDEENDLPMLRVADLAGCPENARDSVKALAPYHLCHCDDGCIADMMERVEDYVRALGG